LYSVPGPLPWLTPADLEVLRENAETESEYERLHLNRWMTSEDRLATRADLAACTALRGRLPLVPGVTYVASLDVGVTNDRTGSYQGDASRCAALAPGSASSAARSRTA
jgi:hypothetical protein